MEVLLLVLLMLAAVLVSSVIAQLVPNVSAPLVQICLGLVVALFAGGDVDIVFEDQELFFTLFIAPLLYDEAKKVDKAALWHNRVSVLALAVGLVVVIMMTVGFTVHAVIPSIGLAAAFALGAALGPTDAVSVASLSKETNIPDRSKSILSGESLINDASGIVAFQFAMLAAVTGSFSPADAAVSFLVKFLGGIAAGIVLGYLGNMIVRLVRSWGLENTTFHVLFDVFVPFITYLIAEQVGVSGVLAVVAAGLVDVTSTRSIGPSISRMNIVSSSVWRVLSFTLNGVVFVLLGTQLPRAMQHTWENVTINNAVLIGYVLLISLIVILSRFVWTLGMEALHRRRAAKKEGDGQAARLWVTREDARNAAILTLAGPKGAVTLVVILTLSYTVAQRQLIIFLACGVIVVTLLLATFVVPLLAPAERDDEDAARENEVRVQLDILRSVMEELAARQTDANRAATQIAIQSYSSRIERIKERNNIDSDGSTTRLRLKALQWEQDYVSQQMADEQVRPMVGYRYLANAAKSENTLQHRPTASSLRKAFDRVRAWLRSTWHQLLRGLPFASPSESSSAMHALQEQTHRVVLDKLQEELASSDSPEKKEDVSALILEYQRTLRALQKDNPSITVIATAADQALDIERLGLRLEMEEIQTRYDDGELSLASARRLRESVRVMQVDLADEV